MGTNFPGLYHSEKTFHLMEELHQYMFRYHGQLFCSKGGQSFCKSADTRGSLHVQGLSPVSGTTNNNISLKGSRSRRSAQTKMVPAQLDKAVSSRRILEIVPGHPPPREDNIPAPQEVGLRVPDNCYTSVIGGGRLTGGTPVGGTVGIVPRCEGLNCSPCEQPRICRVYRNYSIKCCPLYSYWSPRRGNVVKCPRDCPVQQTS